MLYVIYRATPLAGVEIPKMNAIVVAVVGVVNIVVAIMNDGVVVVVAVVVGVAVTIIKVVVYCRCCCRCWSCAC